MNEEYLIDSKNISIYTNEYDLNKKLIKVNIKHISENMHGSDSYFEENIYSYNSRDSLIKIENFYIDNGNKVINSIEYHNDSIYADVIFRNYPNDTTFYAIRRKDSKGNFVEEYIKTSTLGINGKSPSLEQKTIRRYNNLNQLIEAIDNNLIDGTETKRIYTHDIKEDTTTINIYLNDRLEAITKNFKINNDLVEVFIDLETQTIDSTFYKGKNSIRKNSTSRDERREQTIEYDQHGNIVKSVEDVYRTKEAIERMKKESAH